MVIPWLGRAESLLDMGTGGGERLSAFQPLPVDTHATEGWAPNIPVARAKLEPLGVTVHALEDNNDSLPFADSTFDLVINRHTSYDPAEVFRVLKPGGRFITQQVGSRNNLGLNELFEVGPTFDESSWNLEHAVQDAVDAGFRVITQSEAFPASRFYDIGAVVFYLNAISWQVSGFSVDAFRGKLFEIHLLIESQGWLEVGEHRFLIEAERPRTTSTS